MFGAYLRGFETRGETGIETTDSYTASLELTYEDLKPDHPLQLSRGYTASKFGAYLRGFETYAVVRRPDATLEDAAVWSLPTRI